MIRPLPSLAAAFALLAFSLSGAGQAFAQDAKKQQDQKGQSKQSAQKASKPESNAKTSGQSAASKASAAGGGASPSLVATNGDWEVYEAAGAKGKICYALSRPKDRQPSSLKRDPGYIFISTRPGEGVRGEVSIIMGFPLKDNAPNASAEIGSTKFALVTKGQNAWVRNAAEERQLLEAMRRNARAKLVVKAPSVRGNVSTDSYSLAGLAQALDRVNKDCP